MIYVTSDLHGYPLEKFKKLLDSVNFSKDDFLYILGDVIDRGTDGIKLLKWIMPMTNVELILGNHEAMMLENSFLFEEVTQESIGSLTGTKLKNYSLWFCNGAQPTVNALSSIRQSEIKYILRYLQSAPLYKELTVNGRKYILTHSGLGGFKEGKNMSEYTAEELLWNRPKITDKYFDNITTVFGHTPTEYYGEELKGRILKTETWIDIDVGVANGNKPVLLRLDDEKEFYLQDL